MRSTANRRLDQTLPKTVGKSCGKCHRVTTDHQPSDSLPLIAWDDRDKRHLSVGGQSVYVTHTMASVLDGLLRHPGAVCATSWLVLNLYEHERREEPEGPEAVVRATMTALRHIGVPVRNVRGEGYYIEQPTTEFASGQVYEGDGDFGTWQLVKVITEPMLLLASMPDGEQMHLPLSSARAFGLKRIGHG